MTTLRIDVRMLSLPSLAAVASQTESTFPSA